MLGGGASGIDEQMVKEMGLGRAGGGLRGEEIQRMGQTDEDEVGGFEMPPKFPAHTTAEEAAQHAYLKACYASGTLV